MVLVLALGSACAPAQQPPVLSTPLPTQTPAPTLAPRPTVTPFPTFVPEPTWTPVPPPEVKMVVSSYTTYRVAPTWVYIAGVAVNRGTVAAGEVRIAVSLLDAQGRVAATGSMNEAGIWYVPPGGNYPFLIIIPTAPKEWKDVKIQFETKFYSPTQLHKPYWNLKVDKVVGQPPKSAYPNYGYTGAVTNMGDQSARMVHVAVIAYGAGDKVLDVADGYVPFEFLKPGQDAPFDVRFKNIKTPPARYETVAEGHLAN